MTLQWKDGRARLAQTLEMAHAFRASLERNGDENWNILLATHSRVTGLVIVDVGTSARVAAWNERHPEQRIARGQAICEINGLKDLH